MCACARVCVCLYASVSLCVRARIHSAMPDGIECRVLDQIGTGRMHPSTHKYWEDAIDSKGSAAGAPGQAGPAQAQAANSTEAPRGQHGKPAQSGAWWQGRECLPPPVAMVPVSMAGFEAWPVAAAQHATLLDEDASQPAAAVGDETETRQRGVEGSRAMRFGAGALFRSSWMGGGKSASCKAQSKLSSFVTVSAPTRQHFKPPRAKDKSGLGGDRDVLDDKIPWWSAAASTAGRAARAASDGALEECKVRVTSDCDRVSDSEDGTSCSADDSAAGKSEGAARRAESSIVEGGQRPHVNSADCAGHAESGADALGKRLGARGGGFGLKRFKTANPFATVQPTAGVASKFFGASTGVEPEPGMNGRSNGERSDPQAQDADAQGGDGRSSGDVRRAGFWTCLRSKADALHDAEEEDRQAQEDAVGMAISGFAYRGSSVSEPSDEHRYVSSLVLPRSSSSSSTSSLLRRNSSTASASSGAARTSRAGQPLRSLSSSGAGIAGRSGCTRLGPSRGDENILNEAAGGDNSAGNGSGGERKCGAQNPPKDCSRRGESPIESLAHCPARVSNGPLASVSSGGRNVPGAARPGAYGQRLSLPHRGPSSRGAFSATSIDALACFALNAPSSAGPLRK